MSWACDVIHKGRLWALIGDSGKKTSRAEFEAASLSQLPWLYTCAFYLTLDRDMAEDLVQETYLQAYGQFRTRAPDTCHRVWLLCTLRRLFIRQYRKRISVQETPDLDRQRQDTASMVEGEMRREVEDPRSSFRNDFSHEEVAEAVKLLPEENRLALILVDIEELSYQDAARVMKCSQSTLRSRISRGRGMLQAALHNKVVRQQDGGLMGNVNSRAGS